MEAISPEIVIAGWNDWRKD